MLCTSSVSVRMCYYSLQLFLFYTQVKERGGNCVPVVCDSTKDEDIEELFERIKCEQNGRLDILVNNAYAGVQVHTALTSNICEIAELLVDTLNVKQIKN